MTTKRQIALAKAGPGYDPASPPPGTRLQFGAVASRLGVTITQMADACGLGRSTVADLLSNRWPVGKEATDIRAALTKLLVERGATAEELATLFHAQGRGTEEHPRRGPDERYVPPAKADKRRRRADHREIEMLQAKQSLTPQAKRHFKLFTNPFGEHVTQGAQLYVSTDAAYCRESIWQCAQTAGFMALVGESGSGKTTLLEDLEARLDEENRPLVVMKPSVLGMEGNDTKGKAIKSADILAAIITTLKPDAVPPQTLQARTTEATRLLTNSARAGNDHLLVVEEAHSMPDTALKHLKRMNELRLGRKPLMGILLLAQPELKVRLAAGLDDGSLREVAQRCEVIELLPLDAELPGYLRCRAEAAGVTLDKLMDEGAVAQLRERLTLQRGECTVSMCYPLAVNNFVTRALNIAAELCLPIVTRDVILAV